MPPEVRARGGRRAMAVETAPAASAVAAARLPACPPARAKGGDGSGLRPAVQAVPAGDRQEGGAPRHSPPLPSPHRAAAKGPARPGPVRSALRRPQGRAVRRGQPCRHLSTRDATPPAARGQGRARDVPGAAGAGMAFAMHAEWHIQARQLPRLGRLLPAQGTAGSGAYPNARCRAPTQARPVYIIRLAPARMGRAESVGSISGGPARSRSLQ